MTKHIFADQVRTARPSRPSDTTPLLVALMFAAAFVPSVARAEEPEIPPNPVADAGPSATQSSSATEARLAEQEAEIRELEQRLDSLESLRERLEASSPPETSEEAMGAAAEVSASSSSTKRSTEVPEREDPLSRLSEAGFPKSIPLFGSDFRLGFGGYAKIDALYDISGSTDRTQFLIAQIPTKGSPEADKGGYFNLFARETRFNFDVRYVSDDVPFNQVFIELDFFGTTASGTVIPRLRHAYVRWGELLVGQSWTILTELRGLPFIIDFAYGDALFGGRSPQIRWEHRLSSIFSMRLGIEMTESGGIENPFDLAGAPTVRLPRLAGALSAESDRGFLTLGGSVAELRWDGDGAVEDVSVPAWATVLTGRVYLTESKSMFLGVQGSIGRGAAGMILAFAAQDAGATLAADGTLDPMYAWNASICYGHRWAEWVSTNLAFSVAQVIPTDDRGLDKVETGWVGHTNIIYHVSKPMQFGIEYMVGERFNLSGETGVGHRVQSMAMYTF